MMNNFVLVNRKFWKKIGGNVAYDIYLEEKAGKTDPSSDILLRDKPVELGS